MKRARNSVRVIALAAALCLLLTMGVFAAENGSVWITETDTDNGTTAVVVTDAAVTDGVVTVNYDAEKLTYESVTPNDTYVAMHAVNTEDAGVVRISWVAPAAAAPAGNDWLFRVNFAGASDETVTMEGVLTGGTITDAPEVDKTDLQKAVLEAQGMNEEGYTAETWTGLEEALAAAEAVLADPTASQVEVDAAAAAVRAAIDALEEIQVVDTTELQKNVGIAESLTASDYTAESWTALQEPLENGKAVLADADATQEEVDAAAAALKAAVDALELAQPAPSAVDTAKLQKNVGIVEGLTPSGYTAESWDALEKALENAKAVLADPDATQEEVDAANAALEAALGGLKLVDTTELKKTIGVAEGLKKSNYTKASWKALEKALKTAKNVLADAEATQEEVDAANAALKAAIAGLELSKVANTGDEASLLLPVTMAVFSVAAMVAVAQIMRKNKKEGEA